MKWNLIIFAIIVTLVVTLIASWLWFSGDGFLPTGRTLTVSDWLYFWGAYLGVISTTVLSTAILYQNDKFKKLNYERQSIENKPVFRVMCKNEHLMQKYGYLVPCAKSDDLVLNDYLKITLFNDQAQLEHSNEELSLSANNIKVYMMANCGNNTGSSIGIKCVWNSNEKSLPLLPVFLRKDYVYPIVIMRNRNNAFKDDGSIICITITYCDTCGQKMLNTFEIELSKDRIVSVR